MQPVLLRDCVLFSVYNTRFSTPRPSYSMVPSVRVSSVYVCLSAPFSPISSEMKLVETSNLVGVADTPFSDIKVKDQGQMSPQNFPIGEVLLLT